MFLIESCSPTFFFKSLIDFSSNNPRPLSTSPILPTELLEGIAQLNELRVCLLSTFSRITRVSKHGRVSAAVHGDVL